ncbi:Zinc carboxypeptidase [Maribacter sedimenticola]|uniref:Zinc carboxypeptidase n=1 Tax=Maribacter sedimenticola TaxID=228956 RepID=A0ABY1SH19_9FLAO|nr:M14 family zinc carboxypeptidase [Maribacter sedimenticola]SNR47958.1 Zinc carboxypeptidase [Maribacter sedimenticola]
MALVDKEYNLFYVSEIKGRYVHYDLINSFLNELPNTFKNEVIGKSVRGEEVRSITFGQGPNKILMWSQMHGNESTTTKAVLDLLRYLEHNDELKRTCTLRIIPILNPDGARDYTRVNANGIDLNRDAQDLSQPESIILKQQFDSFSPNFCFNLHDQRTIFNVGDTNKPATVSFLAPAFDEERNNSPSRARSMQLIAAMNETLHGLIPGQIGRYDDGFNANCVGDAFQMKGIPTILFEAGHYPDDYSREHTRMYIFNALLKAIATIADNTLDHYKVDEYLAIPENSKQFVDILIYNYPSGKLKGPGIENGIAVQYKEVLENAQLLFKPELHEFEKIPQVVFGHKMIDFSNDKDLNWLKKHGILKLLN